MPNVPLICKILCTSGACKKVPQKNLFITCQVVTLTSFMIVQLLFFISDKYKATLQTSTIQKD